MDSQVTVYGAAAGPSDATWLNEGIRTHQVETSLPNTGKLNIIKSINLEQLSLMFTEATAYDPMTGSNLTTAAFTLPFAFPVDITALAQKSLLGMMASLFLSL